MSPIISLFSGPTRMCHFSEKNLVLIFVRGTLFFSLNFAENKYKLQKKKQSDNTASMVRHLRPWTTFQHFFFFLVSVWH